MAKFELDNQMLKKLETLNKLCLIINTMETQVKASYQINHDRIIICVQENFEYIVTFPLYTYQRHFVQLTYADLDEAIQEMNEYVKYASK